MPVREVPAYVRAAVAARAATAQTERDARKWAYLLILLQEAGVDPAKVPPEQLKYALMSPYERHGYTQQSVESWVSMCDPAVKPKWNEIDCFRTQARAALKRPSSLGRRVALVGGVAFTAAFLVSYMRRR
jgi:hypothetical protein